MRVFAQIKYGNISKVYALLFTADESLFFGLPSKVNTKNYTTQTIYTVQRRKRMAMAVNQFISRNGNLCSNYKSAEIFIQYHLQIFIS